MAVLWRAPGGKAGKCLLSSERAWPNPLNLTEEEAKGQRGNDLPTAQGGNRAGVSSGLPSP